MKIILISVFLISIICFISIPDVFGVQYPVIIHSGVADNREMNFLPSVIEIEKGDTIIWKNLERAVYHTVTSASGLFDERLINCTYFEGGVGICGSQQSHPWKPTFSYTFEEFGTYDYNCKLHSWMKGVVKVIELGSDAELAVHGDAGDMYIDKSQYEVIEDGSVKIKIYGKVKDPGAGAYIIFTITKPDGSTSKLKTHRTGEGYYQLILSVNYEDRGTYNVVSTYGLENIGTANFVVVERPNPTIENPFPPSDDESTNVIGSSFLTITTDFQSYEKGDKIKISGQFSRYLEHGLQLTLQMLDPRNNIITVSQTSLNKDGTYYMSINSNGPMFKTEGDYTIKVKYGTWDASTKFFLTVPNTFNPQSPAPSTQSKTSTLLILDSIPSTFEAQGQNSQAEVIVSGKLTSSDRQYVITSAIIQLKAERWGTTITTDGNGEFSFKKNWDVGNNYGVYAVFDGTSNFEPSKSQTEYFGVVLTQSIQPQLSPPVPSSGGDPTGGIVILVIVSVIIGVVVVAVKRRKKTPIAPLAQQRRRRRSSSKASIQPSGGGATAYRTYTCPKCGGGDIAQNSDGSEFCRACGWKN